MAETLIDPSTSQLAPTMPKEIQRSHTPTMEEIIVHAMDSKVEPDVLQKFIAMRNEELARQANIQFSEALNDCQKKLPFIVKATKSEKGKYADLETIAAGVKQITLAHGFSTTYTEIFGDGVPEGKCRIKLSLRHRGGHTSETISDFALDMTGAKGAANKTEIQGKGSTLSYARRYLLLLAFDIVLANEDNDGSRPPNPRSPADPNAPKTPPREQRQPQEPRVTGAQVVALRDTWMVWTKAPAPTTEEDKASLIEAFKYFIDKSLGYKEPSGRNWLNASAWQEQAWITRCMEACK